MAITFRTGDGLTAGTSRLQHKAVEFGRIESVQLTDDMQNVQVQVRVRREAVPYLTDQARFWVVRPRLASGSLSGIETLVSASYIEMDPGGRGGARKLQFVGLEVPPGIRNGEPGRTYRLRAARIGSLGPGSPVFWRDITVGEVLSYDIGDGTGPVMVTVFVRSPFDGFVRDGSHFWNAFGLSVTLGGDGFRVELTSLQAILSGGVAFDMPAPSPLKPGAAVRQMADGSEFELYRTMQDAVAAKYATRQAFVAYFESSVRGLTRGASVEFFGLQIGTVTDVQLDFEEQSFRSRVRVTFEIQPERVQNVAMKESPV